LGWAVARFYLSDPRLSYLVGTRYPTFASFAADMVNQSAYLLRRERVLARSAVVTVELTNACNLRCAMCPAAHHMKRPKAQFPLAMYRRLLDANPELRRIILADWGEPLLHPEAATFVRLAALRGIQAMITTNGTLLDDRRARELLDAGLHIMRFSLDGVDQTYHDLRGVEYDRVRRAILGFLELRDAGNYRTAVEISCVVGERSVASVQALRDEWTPRVDFVNFQGQLLYGGPTERTRPCRELYRSLTLLAGGEVVPCCVDYDGVLAIGNLRDEIRLPILANSPRLCELRRAHQSGHLPPFCRNCVEFTSPTAPRRF
jgi:uncharacterized Fe-S cluster-containing radical SAM superfamily protein